MKNGATFREFIAKLRAGKGMVELSKPASLKLELAGVMAAFDGKPVYVIQVAEKGICWLKIRAKGRPGHGSQPHDDNAVVHLARAVDRLATRGLPYHVVSAAAGFLEADLFLELQGA